MTLYWATSNIISLVQSVVLRQPTIRQALKLPLPPKKVEAQKKKKGISGFRESKFIYFQPQHSLISICLDFRNSKLLAEVEKRKQLGGGISHLFSLVNHALFFH